LLHHTAFDGWQGDATAEMSDSDQYDAVMFLLSHGADCNRGNVLFWVRLQFYSDKCTDLDFIELFRLMIEKHGADANFQDLGIGPCMLDALNEYLYDDETAMLPTFSDQFMVAITTFLRYNGDINIQHLRNLTTLVSSLCQKYLHMKQYVHAKYKAFHSNVCNIATVLLCHGADLNKWVNLDDGWKAIHYSCDTENLV
jgi:hypothetical protein